MLHDFLSVNRQEIFTAWFLSGLTRGCVLKKSHTDQSGLTLADVGVSDVSLWMLVVKRLALFAVVSGGVVETVVANSSADVSWSHVHGHVKVTRVRVLVTVTLCGRHGNRTKGHSVSQHVDKVQVISNLTVVSSAAAGSGQGHNDWLLIHVN